MTDSLSGGPAPWPSAPPAAFPCPYCAQPVQAGAALCWRCGSRLVPAATPGETARRFAAATGLAAGGVLVGVSPVLPWFQVLLLGNANLFDVARLANSRILPLVLLPVALTVCGVAAIIAAVVLREGVAARATGFVLFGVAGVLGGLLLVSLLSGLANTGDLLRIGLGPWVSVTGALFMLLGAVVPQPASRQPRASGRAVFSSITCTVAIVVAALGLTAAVGIERANRATADNAAATLTPTPAAPSPEPVLPAPPTSAPQSSAPTSVTTEDSEPPAAPRNTLADAEAVVRAKGYRPYPGTSWESASGLQVILATITESGDGYANRAFFFNDGKYLGTDTSADSAGIQASWSTDTTVALSYELYNAEDPLCCPTANAAAVRYHWTGTRLIPLDAIPPDDPAANPSRR
ncbi:LppP/LprE family lipoprotein [Amycolatopsis circi]|uniref:LppP/LprE family lipoprotein n=1 Tax=Amycolatopsis circi TaxID=871959 RepID=UPI000E284D90|nr:LppP/LprE family lipoprotein [Amycolatopsis circi]